MRDDMFKVIVERPRRGVGHYRRGVGHYRTLPNEYRAAKRFKLDADLQVNDDFTSTSTLPMRSKKLGYGGKELNENLRPLYRFIDKQVDRLWNDVYSEICEHLDCNSTVKQHVRDHIQDHVSIKTFIGENGEAFSSKRGWVSNIRPGELFVDADGYLRRMNGEIRKRWRRKDNIANENTGDRRKIDGVEYEKENGVWYRVITTTTERMESYYTGGVKASMQRLVVHTDVRKWTVNKNDLRDLRLD